MIGREDLEIGMKSKFWEFLGAEIDNWIDRIHLEMEDPDVDFATYKRLVGSVEALKRIKILPEVTMEDLLEPDKRR